MNLKKVFRMTNKASHYHLFHIIPVLFTLFYFSSCVTNKEMTYLQYGNEGKSRSNSDSVVRTYTLKKHDYTIQVDDRLEIKIASLTPELYNPFAMNDPDLIDSKIGSSNSQRDVTKGYVVKSDGSLELPMIGKISVKGLNFEALEDTLQERAKVYLKDPVVKVGLLNFQYSVLSEGVNKMITTDNRNITVLQAISLSGVQGEYIDFSRVKVVRHNGDHAEVFYLNLLDENLVESNFYYIQPNDVIVLLPLKQRNMIKYFGKNAGTFASIASVIISLTTLVITLTK